jgi:hypothetical protein
MMGSDSASFYTDSSPRQLDIVVPKTNAFPSTPIRFQHMLQAMHYNLLPMRSKSGPYAPCTDNIEIYHNPVRPSKLRGLPALTSVDQISDTTICLLHARSPSVLNVVLHSPSTAMFKILSASYIYDFYPSLSTKRVTLTVSKYIRDSPAIVYSFGMRSYPANSPLYRDCVRVCPAEVRCTRGLPGVAKLQWNSTDKSNFLAFHYDGFENEILMWRLSDHCYNHACDTGGRPRSLYDDVPLISNSSLDS